MLWSRGAIDGRVAAPASIQSRLRTTLAPGHRRTVARGSMPRQARDLVLQLHVLDVVLVSRIRFLREQVPD